MASGKSTIQRIATLQLWLTGVVPTVPADYDVDLYTTAPNADGGGVIVSGGSYAPASITTDPASWDVVGSNRLANAVEIVFPQATADWGTIVAVALRKSGDLYYWGLLTQAVIIINGQTRYFPIGALEVIET